MRAIPLLAAALTLCHAGAAAQSDALRRLETGEDSRGWEAVGRIDVAGRGFCTGALIAPDRVLTAAHCLFDTATGERIAPGRIEFLAGWRNGRASAYRQVRRAAVHPDYAFENSASAERVRNDLALLELFHPVRNTTIIPFETDRNPAMGDRIAVVSYAHDRAEAPSLQEVCEVTARQQGVVVMSCDVDFGSSGAPVFSFDSADRPRIVSVVSAKAMVEGARVALGTSLEAPLAVLEGLLGDTPDGAPRGIRRLFGGNSRDGLGAKFVRP